jgi:hypothetical protein
MTAALKRIYRRVRYGEPIVIVSGLPRSGTSMAMKMLQAGGMRTTTDGIRTADEDNPEGYFEDERVKDLAEMEDKTWLKDSRGKAIKVIANLLPPLPETNNYKVIFMERDIEEVLASQKKMLARRGETSATDDERMTQLYRQSLDKVKFQLRFRDCFDVMFIRYKDVIEDPLSHAARMCEFLGRAMDPERMAGAVDENLYRNRKQ